MNINLVPANRVGANHSLELPRAWAAAKQAAEKVEGSFSEDKERARRG